MHVTLSITLTIITVKTRLSIEYTTGLNYYSRNKQQRKSCKMLKYKVRWFYSKGAALVLIWTLLTSIAGMSLFHLAPPKTKFSSDEFDSLYKWLQTVLPNVLLLVVAPLSGWLADTRLGNYKVIRAGFVLLFLASIMGSMFILLTMHIDQLPTAFSELFLLIIYSLQSTGLGICNINMLQLGLDQMPDASAANITSFIAWITLGFFAGIWICDACIYLPYFCASDSLYIDYQQIWTLFPVLCMCLVVCTDFIISRKWLIIEPKSPQSLKQIFQVLKFAKQHKAPVNRSALTYWEEDIPSRMDLGKSKYGGPFTTEQVEDVKTFLRILAVSVPIWIIVLALCMQLHDYLSIQTDIPGFIKCADGILNIFTYNPWWCITIGAVIYEFLIYPFIRDRLPSMLKRVGIFSFLIIGVNTLILALSIFHYYSENESSVNWPMMTHSIFYGLLIVGLYAAVLEFVCAQSPYSMRGMLSGYMLFGFWLSHSAALIFTKAFVTFCKRAYCTVIYESIAMALSIIGFILHCILAHWYKRRVRDDGYHPQRVVEEVYDRYLSAPH